MKNRIPPVLWLLTLILTVASMAGCAQTAPQAQYPIHAEEGNRLGALGAAHSVASESSGFKIPDPCPDDERESERIQADGQGRVSRTGNTLTIATSGKLVRFSDEYSEDTDPLRHVFCRFIPEVPGYLVRVYGEGSWYELISDSGNQIDLKGPPVVSPNRRYIAASDRYADFGGKAQLVEIIRDSQSTSFKDLWEMYFDEQIWHDNEETISGPGPIRWLNETRFEFAQVTLGDEKLIGWIQVFLSGNRWQAVTAPLTTAQPATTPHAAVPPVVAPSSNSSNSSQRRLTLEERATCRAQAEQGRNRQEQRQLFRECRQGVLMSASTVRSTQPNIPTPQSQGNNPNKWPQEIQEYVSSMHTACNEIGTPGNSSNDLVQSADLNGDGLADWVLDERAYSCEGAASLFGGGTGGSQTVVWAGLPGGVLSKSFEHANFGIEITVRHVHPTLFFQVGGPLCGQSENVSRGEMIGCLRPITWNTRQQIFEFAPLSQIEPLKAR